MSASQLWAWMGLLMLAGGATAVAAPPPMQRHVSEQPAFVLYRPATWSVRPLQTADRLVISVTSPDGATGVELEIADNRERRLDAVVVLAAKAAQWRARHPDLAISAVQACKEARPSCAVATFTWQAGSAPMTARYFVHGGPDLMTMRSYRAPSARLTSERALLLDVLTNVTVQASRPLSPRMVMRRAEDGSSSLTVPDDWNLLAAKGAVISGAPQGRAGFVLTSFQAFPSNLGVPVSPGVIISPYRGPDGFLRAVFQQFRNRDTRVLAAIPDGGTPVQCVSQVKRGCDAADIKVSWTSPEGVACTGGFKVVTFHPNFAGQWFGLIAGVWGPADDLARWVPVLEKVSASFAIDDRYAKEYIRAGMARVRELELETRSKIQSLYSAIEDNQRAYERRSADKDASNSKWDDYRRGNSYWISDLEGGKVYRTDPWGLQDMSSGDRLEGRPQSYIHFEGESPRHPSEHMREISGDEARRLQR